MPKTAFPAAWMLLALTVWAEPHSETKPRPKIPAPQVNLGTAGNAATDSNAPFRIQGDDVWVLLKNGKIEKVSGFAFGSGEPIDAQNEPLDLTDETRVALAAHFQQLLAGSDGSPKLRLRAQLFTTAEKVRIAHAKKGVTLDSVSSYCTGCHSSGGTTLPLPDFIDNPDLWKEFLTSPSPEIRAYADKWTAKLHRAVLDRGSMPRLDHESMTAFRNGAEGKRFIQFLEQNHRPRPVSQNPVKQLLGASTLARYRGMIPQVASAEISAILNSPATFFYDEHLMPSMYIDDKPQVVGVLPTAGTIAAGRTQIISGGKFRFPFGQTAGTHASPGSRTFNFIHLPEKNGHRLPVTVKKVGHLARWVFPEGTVIGEVLYQNNGQAKDLSFELRVSWKEDGEWKYDVFRPFPTSEDLLRELARRKDEPGFSGNKYIAALEKHLKDPSTLTPDSLNEATDNFNGFFPVLKAGKDTLPPLDTATVDKLLRQTPFKSSLAAVWRSDPSRSLLSYAPTTTNQMHLVPSNYKAHFFRVETAECNRCHSQTQRTFWTYFSNRYWNAMSEVPDLADYGKLWGSDRKFSFSPIQGSGGEPQTMHFNRSLINAGVLEPYNASRHSAADYPDTSIRFPEPP